MMRHLTTVLALFVTPVSGCIPAGIPDQGWVGQPVILKEGAVLKDGSHAGADQGLDYVYRVEDVNGERLRLTSEARTDQGWVPQSQVVRLDRAIDYLTTEIRDHPTNRRPYGRRGLLWSEKGEHDKAIADCNEAIRLDPKSALGYFWSATLEYARAIADFTKAVQLDSKFAYAWNGRA